MLVKKEVVEGSAAISGLKDVTSTGTSVLIEGHLKKTPEGTKQVTMAICPPHIVLCVSRSASMLLTAVRILLRAAGDDSTAVHLQRYHIAASNTMPESSFANSYSGWLAILARCNAWLFTQRRKCSWRPARFCTWARWPPAECNDSLNREQTPLCSMVLQQVELEASAVLHVGKVDAAAYPLAKKKTSYEFLREKVQQLTLSKSTLDANRTKRLELRWWACSEHLCPHKDCQLAPGVICLNRMTDPLGWATSQAHLRPRTNTIGAVARIRNALAYATHGFFQARCRCRQWHPACLLDDSAPKPLASSHACSTKLTLGCNAFDIRPLRVSR